MAQPLLCAKCWGYDSLAKNCKAQERCQKCGEDHKVTECEKEIPEYAYCGGSHRVGHRECPKHKVEEGICKLKQQEKISFAAARQMYLNSNPVSKTYADVVRRATAQARVVS